MKKRKGKFGENGFEDWGGYMGAKKSKLMEQFNNEAVNSGIKENDLFKDIAIFVNGYTEPSSDELRLLMMRHGGVYHHYFKSGQTTHVIATNLPDSKFKLMSQLKIVKPNWITDSIKSGRVLNYQDYLLLSNQSKTQPVLNFNTKIKNATDDGFIEEFYNNSRLHHISSLGADLKEYILSLRSKKPYIFPGREKLKEINKRSNISSDIIMHIDMDCFFVSVGIRNRPDLIDKPVAVTHAKGNRNKPREGTDVSKEVEAYRQKTGNQKVLHWAKDISESDSMAEIASCSYAARQAGVKNGMFVGTALKLCPNLQFIQYNFEDYKKVSYILYDTVARYTLDIEAVSCDEMYADCTSFLSSLEISPMQFASIIRSEIKEKTGCPCSVGFGRNKLLARLATKKAKPDGQFHLEDDQVESFLYDKPVSDLPGVGRSTSYKFRENGIFTCGDLQSLTLSQLQKDFGHKLGETLYNACRGNIEKGLTFDQIRKSVSADVNYGIRFKDDNDRDVFLKNLSQEVPNRLESIGMKGRSITLKVMVRSKDAPEETAKYLGHGVCDSISKGTSLSIPVSNKEIIFKEVLKIMKTIKADSRDLRGIGIQISRLESHKKDGNDILSFFKNKNLIKKKEEKEEKVPLPESPPKVEKISIASVNNRKETSRIESKSPSKNDGVHSFVSPIEIRLLIKQWVENGKKPKEKDKTMVTEYLRELVNNYRFEDLHILLKSFHRCVLRAEEFSECWKMTFNNILDCVQNSMLTEHKSRLKIDCDF